MPKESYPLMSISTWHKLRTQFKRSIPKTLSKRYLATALEISEGSARTNVLAPLKQLGFLDENGNSNQDLIVKFRDDSKYPQCCSELLNATYPQELRDLFPDKKSNIDKVSSWFMSTGVGAGAAKKSAKFYLELVEANPDSDAKRPATSSKKTKGKSSVTEKSASRSEKKTIGNIPQDDDPIKIVKPRIVKSLEGNGVTININIQLTVPETSDESVYDKFFEAMKRHLLT